MTNMNNELIAVVLAGGAGKRFWPIRTNKLLLRFFNRPFFDYTVTECLPPEVTKVIVICSPSNEKILRGITLSVPSTILIQTEPKGMADALLTAAPLIGNAQILVIFADVLGSRQLYRDVLKTRVTTKAFGVIPAWEPVSYYPGGYLAVKNGRVTDIVEKPGEGSEPSSFVNISGHYLRNGELLTNELKRTKSSRDDVYEQALSRLMKHEAFVVHRYSGLVSSLKYPWNVHDVMMQFFSTHAKADRGKNVEVQANVILEGPVILGDNVKIFEHTKIIGPAYIGPNTIIGNNNLIRESHIGENSVTGFNTDITRSYVGNDCWFHTNYIGDSVVEEHVSMGSGAVLANLRLDEGDISSVLGGTKVPTGRSKLGAIIGRDVRIGVNASIMPGVKIGAGSFVGAGVVLDRDLPDETYCSTKPGYEVKKNTRAITPHQREEFKKKL